jgi:hypothetical protein
VSDLLTPEELAYLRQSQDDARPTPAVLRRRVQGTTASGGRANSYAADVPVTVRLDNTERRVPAQVTAIAGAGKAVKITMDLVECQSGDLIKVSETEVYEQVTDGDPDQWATAQVIWAKRTVSPRRG